MHRVRRDKEQATSLGSGGEYGLRDGSSRDSLPRPVRSSLAKKIVTMNTRVTLEIRDCVSLKDARRVDAGFAVSQV